MVPAPHHPKRSDDPEGTDFTDMRIPGPKQWKKVFFWIGSLATFIGTLVMMGKDVDKPSVSPERTAVLERSVRMEGKLDDLIAAISEVQAEHAQHDSQLREIKRIVANIDKARNAGMERAEDRHAEIMSMFNEFKEKGIRRK